ncbi:UNVERIFIED_CONTAM: hypothetical protein Sindi_2665400 [Sesamum indicum]
MQLSPNSVSHVLLFIIVMKHLDLPPTFDNFWSLTTLPPPKGQENPGGPRRDRYFFLQPPPGKSWDFYVGWRESKPKPETYGEGFESDLINYITLFCDLLTDSVAESEIMLARIANKARAKKGTLPPSIERELKRAATASKGKTKELAKTPTPSPATAIATDQPTSPIEVGDHTPDTQVEVVEVSEDRGLKRKRGKEKEKASIAKPTESRSKSGSDPSSRAGRQGRLEAKLAAATAAKSHQCPFSFLCHANSLFLHKHVFLPCFL